MKNVLNTNLKDLWYVFLTVTLPIICVGGASAYPLNLRLPLIYATGIIFVFVFIFGDIKIKLNAITASTAIFLSFLAISATYSYDKDNTINLITLYVCAFTLLFINLPNDIYSRIITVMYVFCLVIAFSIIISAFVNNCMLKYFKFIVNPLNTPSVTASITRELNQGAFSGFAREKAEAAYILNVGVAISFSKYFSAGKLSKKNMLFLFVFLAALMLTGKRTLFVICIICFAVFMIISNIQSKAFLFIYISIIALCVLFVLIMFVPKISNIFNRFMDNENLETLGNRDMLWKYLYYMISKHWKFGSGFGSFNRFAADNGLTVGGKEWLYNGHNSYLQAFGELGIIGSALLLGFVVISLIVTFNLVKRVKDDKQSLFLVFFSLYIQMMVIIYAVTGNPIYSRQIVFVWFFAIGIALSIKSNLALNSKNRELKGNRI